MQKEENLDQELELHSSLVKSSKVQHQKHRSHFFIFVNSVSGGGLGSRLLSQQVEEYTFRLDGYRHPIKVHVFSMRQHRKRGFSKLKKVVQSGKKASAIICGGDGTVTWVVQQLVKYSIDPDLVAIGIIPGGTGNDFSIQLGWGKKQNKLVEDNFQPLKDLIKQWIEARQEYFDLWQVEAESFEYGRLQKVKDGNNVRLETNKLTKPFCNYFSFGMDGKIGYSFDMHRTSTRYGNLAMYGLIGVLKAATKTKQINELVQSMEIRNQLSDQIPQQSKLVYHGLKISGKQTEYTIQSPSRPSEKKISKVFESATKSKSSLQDSKSQIMKQAQENAETQLKIQKDYCNMLALNINSFMGGVRNVWSNARNLPNKNSGQFTSPSTSDGKLQFLCFSSSAGLATERVIGGFADRITQGGGPYHIQFKEYSPKQKHRTYLQIDGQYIRFTHPKSVIIRKTHLVSGGRIKVLRKRQKID